MSTKDLENTQMKVKDESEDRENTQIEDESFNHFTCKVNILKGKLILLSQLNKSEIQENLKDVPLGSLLNKLTSNITNANLLCTMLMNMVESQMVLNNLSKMYSESVPLHFAEKLVMILEKEKILNEKQQQLTEYYLDAYQKKIEIIHQLSQAYYEQINLKSIKKTKKEKKPEDIKTITNYRAKIKTMITIQKFLMKRIDVDFTKHPEFLITIIKAHRNAIV